MKIYSGIKMYRFKDDEDHPEVIRLLNVDYDKKIIKYRDSEGKQQKEKLTNLTEKYKVLAPDGIISFNDVSMPYNGRDVIVALQPFPKSKDKLNQLNDNLPYAVCRQFVVDMFSMCTNPESNIIGMSVSKDTCPSTVDYKLMLACNEINYTRMIAVYLDDTLDGILSLFNNKPFDDALDGEMQKVIVLHLRNFLIATILCTILEGASILKSYLTRFQKNVLIRSNLILVIPSL